jgi:hypothetical protein
MLSARDFILMKMPRKGGVAKRGIIISGNLNPDVEVASHRHTASHFEL